MRAALNGDRGEHHNSNVIPPLETTALPPPTPESSSILSETLSTTGVVLPLRADCARYVAKFFDEIHCLHWFFSTEQFYDKLENTYTTNGREASSSWLCSLYSMFALGSAGLWNGDITSSADNSRDDAYSFSSHATTSADYLALAKSLVPRVCDEADLDSVRGLSILSLALQTACFRTTSYLYIGLAVRIAFSLGLHRDKSHLYEQSLVEKECARRVWWTVYLLDQETSLYTGNCSAIDQEETKLTTPLPSEQVCHMHSSTAIDRLTGGRY